MQPTEEMKILNVLSLFCIVCSLVSRNRLFLWPALLLIAGSLFDNLARRWIAKGWLKLAEGFGFINSRILLSILFYGVLTPIACAYRMFQRETWMHFMKKKEDTYFVNANETYDKHSFLTPW